MIVFSNRAATLWVGSGLGMCGLGVEVRTGDETGGWGMWDGVWRVVGWVVDRVGFNNPMSVAQSLQTPWTLVRK